MRGWLKRVIKASLLLFWPAIVCSLVIHDDADGKWVDKLLESTPDDYVVISMGDQQYWHTCEVANVACKEQTQIFRTEYGADEECKIDKTFAADHGWDDATRDSLKQYCRQIESNWANDVQQRVVKDLVELLNAAQQPRALLYAGDLTDTGRQEELDVFENRWIAPFLVPIYPGLGNKDYEENLEDCGDYSCANRMLTWLIQYAKKNDIKMDYIPGSTAGGKLYIGSFATSTVSCNAAGAQCAMIINLNNYANYETSFTWGSNQWTIMSSEDFLKEELKEAKALGLNVFIVSHQLSKSDIIQQTIKDLKLKNRVFVLHAHEHEKHKVTDKCAGIQVPFIFTGSVPNDRFTVIQIAATNPDTAHIFLMSANPDGSATIVEHVKETFDKC